MSSNGLLKRTVVLCLALLAPLSAVAHADGAATNDGDGQVDAEVGEGSKPGGPRPDCSWGPKTPIVQEDREQAGQLFFTPETDPSTTYLFEEGGVLRVTETITVETVVHELQAQTCGGEIVDTRWVIIPPPDPRVLWPSLTRKVIRRVPRPDPDLGVEAGRDGVMDIPVKLGLWIGVTNGEPVTARAELPSGAWAESTATLDRIEFDTGTGTLVSTATKAACAGHGTPLPPNDADAIGEGKCGYTYRLRRELGTHTATVRAIWTVVNTTSNNDQQTRPDIVLETEIPIEVFEIQTVGTG